MGKKGEQREMMGILWCGALWIALSDTVCVFVHAATRNDFGQRVGFANDNGIVMQEPRAPLFTEREVRNKGENR